MAAASEEGCDNKSLAFTFQSLSLSERVSLSLSFWEKGIFYVCCCVRKAVAPLRTVAAVGRVARRDRGEQQLSKRARARSRAPYLQLTTHTQALIKVDKSDSFEPTQRTKYY